MKDSQPPIDRDDNRRAGRRGHSGNLARPRDGIYPPNSLQYFMKLRGKSRMDLFKETGISIHQIGHIIRRERALRPDNAEVLGKALNVSAEEIGYSDSPDAYSWGLKAVPIIGSIGDAMRITLIDSEAEPLRKTGAFPGFRPEKGAALLITAETRVEPITGMYLFFDQAMRRPMSDTVIERQAQGARFIVCLPDESLWWRRIKPSSRRNMYHLGANNFDAITDVEIRWVNEIGPILNGLRLPHTT